jgi:hypothetical protein
MLERQGLQFGFVVTPFDFVVDDVEKGKSLLHANNFNNIDHNNIDDILNRW